MKANTILLNSKDNVVTATCDIGKGQAVIFFRDGELCSITAVENIPAWNKAAVMPIKNQDTVIKYGEVIGAAMEDIALGAYVSHLNIRSLPRDYKNELK